MSGKVEERAGETELAEEESGTSDRAGRNKDELPINSQTEPGMLEDEEMPTYISVSSPSRREDSDAGNGTKRDEDEEEEEEEEEEEARRPHREEEQNHGPYHSDDQGGGSVYVLSSGEDSDRPPYNEEDDDDYPDSDDMDEMEMEKERGHAMMDEEEEDEDDDEEDGNPLRMNPDDDEDEAETEFESEGFDRASDDFILNNRLQRHHKERSLSLQDLSISKNSIRSPYVKKRHSLNFLRQNYFSTQQNPLAYHFAHRKHPMPLKYRHVESKVKRYIKDIKEQTRRSMERRIKDQEYTVNKNHTEAQKNDVEQTKPTRSLKDYARKAISDLQREEEGNDAEMLENGEAIRVNAKLEGDNKNAQTKNEVDIYCDIVPNEKNCEERLEKRNGSVDLSSHRVPYQGPIDRSMKFSEPNEPLTVNLVNGHQQAPTLFNLRTLSYEEYMRAGLNTGRESLNRQSDVIPEAPNETDAYNDTEMLEATEVDNASTACPIKIENVKSIRASDESKKEPGNYAYAKLNETSLENPEVTQLKTQLNQKTAQLDTLRDAYQKTLAENIRMKQELDSLKKSLKKYESSEAKASETKVAAVQTEVASNPVPTKDQPAETKDSNNKMSSSSVASTISSIEHWTDSACSPAISIKPPDLTTVLQSDDSMVLTEGTPRKTARPLSRAFITSSRILQTLSNITQGKTKPESPLVSGTRKRTNENMLNVEQNSPTQASSSKKRKAADMLGSSNFLQPFKIPHTIDPQRRKSTCSIDESKNSGECSQSKPEQTNPTAANTSRSASPTSMERKAEEGEELPDNVKCFVYREDENSHDRSFLIQAEEPLKDHPTYERNRTRECGPYLLGNVEVRMSEVNGTISIWGKEISQESVTQTEEEEEEEEEEVDISLKLQEKKTCHCWQKTQPNRFNGSPLLCSTNKKPKIPSRFSGLGQQSSCSHSMGNTIKNPFLLDEMEDKRHTAGSCCSPGGFRRTCENCDGAQYRKEWQCKRLSSSQDKLHSCCSHHAELANERECNCAFSQDRHRCSETPNRIKDKCNRSSRRCSFRNAAETSKHLQDSSLNEEADDSLCKCNTSRCPQHSPADTCEQSSKYCNTIRDISYTCKSSLVNSCQDNLDRHSCNQSSSNTGDEDPLIPPKRSSESHEIRQRRLSGKKVRGILMDLLRGCSDCRNPSASGSGAKNVPREKEAPYSSNVPPQIKVSSCDAEHQPRSNHAQPGDRCCHAYAKRIESQLEQFRMEMERVRSRSDAILDMLSMLHSVDAN